MPTKVSNDDCPGCPLAHQLPQRHTAAAPAAASAACRGRGRRIRHHQHPENQQGHSGKSKEVEQRPPAKVLQDERRKQQAHQVACRQQQVWEAASGSAVPGTDGAGAGQRDSQRHMARKSVAAQQQ